jgi:hypothetical protein
MKAKSKRYETISIAAGFISGCAYVGVDELQKAQEQGWAKVVAVIGLCSIAAVLHFVGAVPVDRLIIARRRFRASISTIAGAGVASLLAAFVSIT